MSYIRHKKLLLLLLLILLGGIVYIWRGYIYEIGYRLNLVPKPAHFTELYFNNPESLPAHTVKGKTEFFSFTIHNLEGRNVRYKYVVYYIGTSGSPIVFTTGEVPLANDESQTIAVSHTFVASNQQGSVVVLLPTLNQHIDFLLTPD